MINRPTDIAKNSLECNEVSIVVPRQGCGIRWNHWHVGRQARTRLQYYRFASHVAKIGFSQSKSVTSLFVYHIRSCMTYLLLYVDDIVLTDSSGSLVCHIITYLSSEFAMSYCGPRCYLLGISIKPSQARILRNLHDTLDRDFNYIHHWYLVWLFLRMLIGVDIQIQVDQHHVCYCIFWWDNLVAWSFKRHHSIFRSSVDTKFRGCHWCGIHNLLLELHCSLLKYNSLF